MKRFFIKNLKNEIIKESDDLDLLREFFYKLDEEIDFDLHKSDSESDLEISDSLYLFDRDEMKIKEIIFIFEKDEGEIDYSNFSDQ